MINIAALISQANEKQSLQRPEEYHQMQLKPYQKSNGGIKADE